LQRVRRRRGCVERLSLRLGDRRRVGAMWRKLAI
jgi:hypothetical protein